MKKLFKRTLATLLAAMLIFGTGTISSNAADIDITEAFTDANFRAAVYWKIGKFAPEPIYDTDVAGITDLEVGGRGIQSLTGLEYFTNLTDLGCSGNQLSSLSTLPSGLKVLYCSGNQLSSLPTLPSGLEVLYCGYNPLEELPALPSDLKELGCAATQLTTLPSLPSGLKSLTCSDNQLTSLDLTGLPLQWLHCSYNNLTTLDVTSLSLEHLDCSYNHMISTSDVKGFNGIWDGASYIFDPQNTVTTHTITYNANGGSVSPTSATVNAGSSVTAPTPTKSYTLTYNVNGGNAVSPSSKSVPALCNGWFAATSGGAKRANAGASYTPTQSETIYAQWTNPAMGTLPTPSHLTSGYTFKGWFTAASGGVQVTSSTAMTGNQTIYAHWESRDNLSWRYSFNNSYENFDGKWIDAPELEGKYYVSPADFARLTAYVHKMKPADIAEETINALQEFRYSDWGGSCYGMALTTVLDFDNRIAINETAVGGNMATMHDVAAPNINHRLASCINYYMISQVAGTGADWGRQEYYTKDSNFSTGMRVVVDNAKTGKPFLLGFCWTEYSPVERENVGYGHLTVGCGYELLPNGDHKIIIYDNADTPDTDSYAIISSNYKTFSYSLWDSGSNFRRWDKVDFITDFSKFDQIDFDGPGNTSALSVQAQETVEDKAYISILASGKTMITDAQGKTLTYDASTGDATGSMQVMSQRTIYNSTADGQPAPATLVFEVPNSSRFTIETDGKGIDASIVSSDMYASIESADAKTAIFAKNEGVSVTGNGQIGYTATLGLNNDLCDMVSMDGTASGNASLKYKGRDVLASGTSGSAVLTVYSDTAHVDEVNFSTTYNDVLVTKTDDEIDIRASSKNNGVYDVSMLGHESKFTSREYSVRYKGSMQLSTTSTTGTKTFEVRTAGAKVSVDNTGKVTSLKAGITFNKASTAEISVLTNGVVTDTCTVKVTVAWWQWLIAILLFGWLWY